MKAPDAHQNPATYAGALLPIVAACVVLFKLNLDAMTQAVIASGLAGVVGVGILISDTFIRRGRAQVAVAQHYENAAQLSAITANPEGNDALVPPPPPVSVSDPKVSVQPLGSAVQSTSPVPPLQNT